jgi:hypothetical protein
MLAILTGSLLYSGICVCVNASLAMAVTGLPAAFPLLILHSCHLMVCNVIYGRFCLINCK